MGTLKKYGDRYKVTVFRALRVSGWEFDDEFRPPKGTVNDTKLADNISRARGTVFELAMCNPWEYFVTLTIDARKYDRYDLDTYKGALKRFLQDYKRHHGCKVAYLFIPEQHKDGAWHMHGFLGGLPADHLVENSHGYLDWPAYATRFGYISLDPVRHVERCSKYITKYISKDMGAGGRDLGQHLYYCSQGLKRAELIKKDLIVAPIRSDYENDWVKIAWYDDLAEALSLFRDNCNISLGAVQA